MLRSRPNPKIALRLALCSTVLLLLLAAALGLGFQAGSGEDWAYQALLALAAAALLAGLAIAWLVTHSITRSTHDAEKVAKRLDRVFQHVNAKDS